MMALASPDPLFLFPYSPYSKKQGGIKGIFGATYLFLIKPAQTEIDALSKIFNDRGVPLQINYVFDF